ncbi:MAG: PEP-CTERM sorting domain-containing protein [Prosthecobacter sp.]
MKRLACLLLAVTALHLQAAIIVNGSFENNTGGIPDSWTATGNLGVSPVQGKSDGSFAVAFSLGNTPSNGVLSQTFSTTLGQDYLLTFDFGKYAVNQPTEVARLVYDIFDGAGFGGASLLSGTVSDGTPGLNSDSSLLYNPYQFAFTAMGALTTLRFTDTSDPQSGGGGFDAMLDNVSVASVPEPSRISMFACALIGLAMRRRR